ncbi:hypothetical protein GCM10027089_59070 [Nocardia thraciensis]
MASAGLPTIARIHDQRSEAQFIATWSKETLVHRLTEMAIHDIFYDEADAKPSTWEVHNKATPGEYRTVRYMSVTVALRHYGLERARDSFEVPSTPDAADMCHDYFVNDVMWSAPYEQLVQRMADEVFHTVFPYRTMLYNLNLIAAALISELDAETCSDEPEIAKLFARRGRLKRKKIPEWVQRAVFFRDQGHCTYCRRDLTGLMHAMSGENYDHMVPLAEGGLNDVTNLQLLCNDCNSKKSAKIIEPSNQYIRWFTLRRMQPVYRGQTQTSPLRTGPPVTSQIVREVRSGAQPTDSVQDPNNFFAGRGLDNSNLSTVTVLADVAAHLVDDPDTELRDRVIDLLTGLRHHRHRVLGTATGPHAPRHDPRRTRLLPRRPRRDRPRHQPPVPGPAATRAKIIYLRQPCHFGPDKMQMYLKPLSRRRMSKSSHALGHK